ncbi:MAG: hypothetical protein PQJ46_17665, partial [Spirochaetales bacterium]|nr:hypothetical protein [Spirochaetales bacterium]
MNQSEFVDSLIKDAENKAAEIIEKAETEAESIKNRLDSKKELIQKETDIATQKKIAQINLLNDAAIKAETRRLKLKLREHLNEEIMKIFYKEIEDKINS